MFQMQLYIKAYQYTEVGYVLQVKWKTWSKDQYGGTYIPRYGTPLLRQTSIAHTLNTQITVTDTFSINEAEKAYKLFDGGKTGKCAILYQEEKQVYSIGI